MYLFIYKITRIYPAASTFQWAMLLFRLLVSGQLILVQGMNMRIFSSSASPYHVHHPFFSSNALADWTIVAAPMMVIMGLLTRLAVVPILLITGSGCLLAWKDGPAAGELSFVYTVVFMLIGVLGPGKFSLDYLINSKMNIK